MTLRVGVRIYPNTQAGRDKVASLLSDQEPKPEGGEVKPEEGTKAGAKKTPKSK